MQLWFYFCIIQIISRKQRGIQIVMLLTHQSQPRTPRVGQLNERPSISPKLLTWKISYQTTKHARLLNMFQNMIANDPSPPGYSRKSSKIICAQKMSKSSYQMYKQRQKCEKQKLQEVHTLENPKLKSDQFYCTLRARESRSHKRKLRHVYETLTLNSIRSEMHERSELKKQIVRTPRQCATQCSPSKPSFPRKYSLDCAMNSTKFTIRKPVVKSSSFAVNLPCRPWSPADFVDPSGFITQGNLII